MPQRKTRPQLDPADHLTHVPLFKQLEAGQLQHIARQAREVSLPRGATLFQKGDPAHGLYLIIFGQIKLAFPSPSGSEKVLEVLGPRQSFGEAVMFLEKPYPVYAQALADSLLLFLPREAIFDLLEREAGFARRMLAGMSMRLHGLIKDVESYSLRSSTQRVIGYLLQHCPDADADAVADFTLPTPKQVLASRLSLTPETLSRIFAELAQAGLIVVTGKNVVIPDLRRLRAYDPQS